MEVEKDGETTPKYTVSWGLQRRERRQGNQSDRSERLWHLKQRQILKTVLETNWIITWTLNV